MFYIAAFGMSFMLIYRFVYENVSKDDIHKLFPTEVLPELQRLLKLLLQKSHDDIFCIFNTYKLLKPQEVPRFFSTNGMFTVVSTTLHWYYEFLVICESHWTQELTP